VGKLLSIASFGSIVAVEKLEKEDPSVLAKTEAKPDRASNLCCYSQRVCHLEKLKGFDFCHKHILEDKASPFKPCDFVAKSNGRRCPNPAPKLPDKGKSFCIIHTRKAELRRAVEERRKRRHHEGDGEENYDGDKEKRRRTSSSNSQKSDKQDGHSSDEEAGGSGDDYLKVDSAWHGDIDSDADSVDSEEEDPLKHAGVWTVEETTRMCRDKMIRLRSLYIAQFKRLQHVLKERKRKYCQAIQAEEEEETGECHLTPTQLLGRKSQNERPCTETLLRKQSKEKKQGITSRQQNVSTLRCTYSPGGNRCTEKVLPLTKHCIKHITHDPNQLLFQRCTFPSKGDGQCERNVAKIFNHSTCRLHVELPANMKRPDVKKDLEDAKERTKLRKARTLEQEDKADVPEALQQKSSALVPPADTTQTDNAVPTTSQPPQTTALSHSSMPSDTSSAGSEKMDIDGSDCGSTDGSAKLPSSSGPVTVASSTSSSVASVSSPTPASESISPGLAAASLVAVCSSPQIPLQGAPLASISSTKPSSVAGTSGEQQSIGEASSGSTKVGVDTKGDSIKDVKEMKGVDTKNTVLNTQEMTKKDSCLSDSNSITNDVNSEKTRSPTNDHGQTKVDLNVSKGKDEGRDPLPASHSVSQSIAQGTSEVVTSHGSSSTSPKVTLPTTSSEGTLQIASKSVLQGTSNTSRVTSPTPVKGAPQVAASHGTSNTTSKVISPTALKITPNASSEKTLKDASKSVTQDTSNISSKVTSSSSIKVAPKESSENSSKVLSKGASQGAPKAEAHKTTPQGTSPTSHTVQKQTTQVISSGFLHTSQSATTSSSTSQPSKSQSAKPLVSSETPRPPFQHLPSGMTASSSKQFSAITSIVSKETSKDSKADPAKSQDQ